MTCRRAASACVSIRSGRTTILAPRWFRSAMMLLLSKALSASQPAEGEPLDERRDTHRVKALAGQQDKADEIAQGVG